MKVNDKVVCVDDYIFPETREQIAKDCPNFVVKGKTYTIREIRDFDFIVSILVEEITNPVLFFKSVNANVESGFKSERFRKIEVKTETIKKEKYETA